MRSIKKINSIKTRIVSAVVSLALILCAVLTFGFVSVDKNKVYADGDTVENGIRFVQIAAGADFAIGLTYDGELYGWSLNGSNSPNVGNGNLNSGAKTLGEYYSTVPTKLVNTTDRYDSDYVFRNGPGSGDTPIRWKATEYHDPRNSGDRIIQIAATRTTAAFITKAGFVYTWGKDIFDVELENEGSMPNYLLLRSTTDGTGDYPWYKPYIINYTYGINDSSDTEYNPGLYNILPNNSFGNASLAAGEYNYILTYSKYTTGMYYSYVWGSLMYAVPNVSENSTYTLSKNSATDLLYGQTDTRKVYQTSFTTGTTSRVTAVAGGYTVGMNVVLGSSSNLPDSSTSLVLRGKNFVSSTAAVNGNTVSATQTVQTNSKPYTIGSTSGNHTGTTAISYKSYTINNAIIGSESAIDVTGNYNGIRQPSSNGSNNTANADLYYGRQSSSGKLQYSTDVTKSYTVSNAYGGAVNDSADSYAQSLLFDVSLGNDVGYGISNGRLYAWGDNRLGQSGLTGGGVSSTPTAVTTLNDLLDTDNNGTIDDHLVSVAAGKQKSATPADDENAIAEELRAFHVESDTFTSDATSGTLTFSDSVQNEKEYITGALTQSGRLYVWSYNTTTNTPTGVTEIKFGSSLKSDPNNYTPNDYNRFAAIYSGYGNNLFAITKLGKVVRITYSGGSFVQTVYDEFKTDAADTAANWTVDTPVNGNVNNNIVFRSVKENDENEPDLGSFTLYVDGGYASAPSVQLNGRNTTTGAGKLNYYGAARNSLVLTNKTGDVYRILDYNFDSQVQCLDGTSTPGREALKPQFYFNGSTTPMTESQQKNMFTYKVVYSMSNGVGIEITPIRSSKGGTITAEFYVARYDCAENFKITADASPTQGSAIDSRSGVVDGKELLYDCKKCTVKFEIENTEAYLSFKGFRDVTEDGTGNASLPLLDPNNSHNNKYSVAVQDVSGGVTALAGYLLRNNSDVANFVNDIVAQMKAQDVGFPSSDHIKLGNLNYYLGATEAARVYGNEYLYLFTDRDGDLVQITPNARITMIPTRSAPTTAVEGTYKRIEITVPISSYTLKTGVAANINTDFDNVYGLYDIEIDGSNLKFKYDIAFFEAKGATGLVGYSGTTPDSYSTVNDASNAFLSATVNAVEYSRYNASYVPDTTATDSASRKALNKQSAVAVFSQPTVRILDHEEIYGSATPNDGYTGAEAIYGNTYTVTRALGVGETLTLRLEEFVKSAGAYIHFSYNNLATSASYTAFNTQFENDAVVLNASGSEITVSPVECHDIDFTVHVQRFYGGSTLTAFAGGNERVSLSFHINVNDDGIKNFKVNEGATTKYHISRTSKIDLMGGGEAINNKLIDLDAKYKDKVVISDLRSADTSILTVSPSGTDISGTEFNVSPVSSGTTFVQFVASIYDRTAVITLTFDVSGLTELGGEIQLIDTTYVAVDLIVNQLRQANSFNSEIERYTVLAKDVDAETGISKAIYFTDASGVELTAAAGYPNGYPKFIKSVSFVDTDTSHPRIRIVPDNDQVETSGVYNMRVRFVRDDFTSYEQAEASSVAIIQTNQKISSTRMIVPDIDDPEDENEAHKGGNVFTVWLDVDNITDGHRSDSGNINSNWIAYGSNTDTVVHIPVQMLLSELGNGTPEDFRIFLVSSTSDAVKYFNYSYDTDATNVVITPLYNTPDPITVNVSVSKNTAGSDMRLMLAFRVNIDGISTTLTKKEYTVAWIVAFFSSLGVLMIIFLIRMIVYWRKRAKQRAIIKRNQELIKMRDRIHNKTASATREQIVKTKLKMEDPKYAKMFNDMRKEKESETGVTLENSPLASISTSKSKASKKKKKGGKKSLAELKAELEAKKAAFAQAQNGEVVNPFVGEVPIENQDFGNQNFGDQGFGGQDFATPVDEFAPQDLDGNAIIFDAPDPSDGMQG
ncbi:MAG: hypothetical protein NC184_05910 [Roseburia sp.]|nr:hypothetical protein [Roseburia sp.]